MVQERKIEMTEQQLVQAYESEKGNLEGLNRRMATFQNLMKDLIGAEQSIDAVGDADNEEILVNLGAGVYKNAVIGKERTVLVSIGGNVLNKKSPKEAKQIMKKRKDDLQKDIDALQGEINTRAGNINNMAKLLNTAMQRKRQQQG